LITLGFPRSDTQNIVPARDDVERQLETLPRGGRREVRRRAGRLPEQLDLSTIAVHNEDQAVGCGRNPVYAHELAWTGSLRAELGQILALTIENHDARVHQSVGDQNPPIR
jgi:hypothetical protein